MSQQVRQRIQVEGRVQGVGFRAFVYDLATRLGLTGLACNHDGGVYVEVEGDQATVDDFTDRLSREAPPLAAVERVTSTDIEPTGASAFEIVARPPGARGRR